MLLSFPLKWLKQGCHPLCSVLEHMRQFRLPVFLALHALSLHPSMALHMISHEKSGWGKNLLSQQSIPYPVLLLTSTTPPRAPEEPPMALLQFFVYTAAASIMPFSHSHLPVSSTTLRKKSKPCPLSYNKALHEPPCPLSSATLPLNYCVLATLAFFQFKNTKFSPDSGHSHRLFLLPRKLFSVRLQLTNSHAS